MALFWWLVGLLLGVLVLTGTSQRWLRGHGLGRNAAALVQAITLAAASVAMWGSFAPTPPQDLLVMLTYFSLLEYGAILLWLRWRRIP